MDVHLDDPAARQRRMWWLRGAGFALVVLACTLLPLVHLGSISDIVALLGFEMVFLAPLVLRLESETQAGTLALEPGRVVISTRRGRRVLRGKDLFGATTAREPGTKRTVLSLSLGSLRAYPVSLTFDRVDEMESVRRALGVGELGRGTVWISGGRPGSARPLFRGFLFVVALLAPFLVTTGGVFGPLLVFFAMIVGLLGELWNGEAVKLWGDRIVLGAGPGREEWTYREIFQLEEDREGLSLRGGHGGGFGRLALPVRGLTPAFSPRERELLLAQIQAAVSRSRTAPPLRSGAQEALENLRRLRSQGERPTSWLSRLDAFAALLGANGARAGYREASVDVDALWTTLEDPDADLELRCAAARILHRRESAKNPVSTDKAVRLRIATAVEAAPDEPARVRLRLMTEDQPREDELEETFDPAPTIGQKMI